MKTRKLFVLIPIALIAVLIIVIGATMISSYNSTVDMRETVDANEAQVKNRLQQRHDKMGQIISAVEGLQDHAEDLYDMITDARAAYTDAKTQSDFINADAAEAEALSRLLVIVEDNPQITATQAYYAYIDEVSAMENALAVARRDYNEAVRVYNAQVKKFPRNLYLSMFNFEKQLKYWKIADGAEEVPIVDFAD